MTPNHHRALFNSAQTIVIKVGSAQLTDTQGKLRNHWLQRLCSDIAAWLAQGKNIVLVSSGAVALGRHKLDQYPSQPSLAHQQAAAAAGQIKLCQAYEQAMSAHHLHTAQLLLTVDDCYNLRRQLNAKNTLCALLASGLIPIVNENDTVATSELRFGDNDRLAAHICHLVKADILLLLSDVDGMYDKDPTQHTDAKHLPEIHTIDEQIVAMAGPKHSQVGTGGMATKVEAAKIATNAGCHLVIADGNNDHPLKQLTDPNTRCTWFLAQHSPLRANQKWLQHLIPRGKLHIDSGAAQAVASGKNLLASGVLKTHGHFQKGDAVEIVDPQEKIIAKGVCHYHAADLQKIMGQHSNKIEAILGYHNGNAVVHCDNILTMK